MGIIPTLRLPLDMHITTLNYHPTFCSSSNKTFFKWKRTHRRKGEGEGEERGGRGRGRGEKRKRALEDEDEEDMTSSGSSSKEEESGSYDDTPPQRDKFPRDAKGQNYVLQQESQNDLQESVEDDEPAM